MKVVIALGSNLGDKAANLKGAISELEKIVQVEKVSSFYSTEPVGGPVQDDFLNAVLISKTNLDPHELLIKCLEIENKFGRKREIKWGPRTLDIDLIAIDNLEINSETLRIPHPLAHRRKFVLQPWHEIDPEAEIVGQGKISELLARCI